jgi:hypothetical protein
MLEHGDGQVKIGRMAVLPEYRRDRRRRPYPALPARSRARPRLPRSDPARATHRRGILSQGRIQAARRRLRRSRHRAPQDGARPLSSAGSPRTPRSRAPPHPASRGSHDGARRRSSPAAHTDSTSRACLRPLRRHDSAVLGAHQHRRDPDLLDRLEHRESVAAEKALAVELERPPPVLGPRQAPLRDPVERTSSGIPPSFGISRNRAFAVARSG